MRDLYVRLCLFLYNTVRVPFSMYGGVRTAHAKLAFLPNELCSRRIIPRSWTVSYTVLGKCETRSNTHGLHYNIIGTRMREEFRSCYFVCISINKINADTFCRHPRDEPILGQSSNSSFTTWKRSDLIMATIIISFWSFRLRRKNKMIKMQLNRVFRCVRCTCNFFAKSLLIFALVITVVTKRTNEDLEA